MKQSFTQEDLVRYLYSETTPAEGRMIRAAIGNDPLLGEDAAAMEQVKSLLDSVSFKPSVTSQGIIMAYSRSGSEVAQ